MKKYIYVLIFLTVFLGGCANKTDSYPDKQITNNIVLSSIYDVETLTPIDVTEIASIETLLDENKYLAEISYEESLYYVVGYAYDGAQYSYRYDVFKKEESGDELLYYSDEIIWLNEFCAFGDNLFWVEYQVESNTLYYCIVQYNLKQNNKKIIDRYDSQEVDEILLSVGDEYIVWYENTLDKSYIKIYNVNKEETDCIMDSKIYVANPYARIPVINSTISYFVEDEAGNIFIEAYQLKKRKKQKICNVQSVDSHERLSECFYNGKYAMWFTDYYNGEYFFYNLETKELNTIIIPEKMYLFSVYVDEEKIYLNLSGDEKCIYSIGEGNAVNAYKVEGGMKGTHFGRNSSGSYIKIEDDTRIGIVNLWK